jgi:dipeptidyl aminopeptidase/acylaminoacyl peptidase
VLPRLRNLIDVKADNSILFGFCFGWLLRPPRRNFQKRRCDVGWNSDLAFRDNPHPAVIFVHGSGAADRESNRFYADLFARHGIATLIYDKRGVGASTGDWRYVHLNDLAEDALAGVQLLKCRKDINPNQIGIFGGSQGGGWLRLPLLAQRI